MQPDLISGDSLNYETTITAYPPSAGWSAVLRLVPAAAGGTPIKITAAVNAASDRYVWQVGPAVTALWVAGSYAWSIWVEKTGERYTQQSGRLVVKPDPNAVVAGAEMRTQGQRVLDALRNAWEAYATGGQFAVGEYTINGRMMKYRTPAELRALINIAERDVQAEEAAAKLAMGLSPRKRFVVRM